MNSAARYAMLESKLLRGRALGNLPEDLEDAYLDEMDQLWWKLTTQEKADANRRAARYAESVIADTKMKPTEAEGVIIQMRDFGQRAVASTAADSGVVTQTFSVGSARVLPYVDRIVTIAG